ncbi:MAG: helix-turn-helix domain-containing protein [Eubacterium sp.]|nr:helix-turn-helix domain-containing protein [Eubacterium sp.]MDE6413081.1 helix-turn-helix domain-containing protein [Eubacterium sp.]
MIFNQRAKNLREDLDLTQEEIAEMLNVSRATVNRYENDRYDMKLTYAIELAKVYNVSLDYIAGLTDEPRPLLKR